MPVQAHTFVTPRSVPWFLVGDAACLAVDAPVDTLVVLLHGLGQRAVDLAEPLAAVVPARTLLLVPEGLSRSLPRPLARRAGASWSTGDDHAMDLKDNLAYLDGLMAYVTTRYPSSRQVLVGFSQGGLMAARWLAQRQRDWAQVVLWAAAVPRDVDPEALRRGLGKAHLVMALGDGDQMVTPEVAAAVKARLDEAGLAWGLHTFSGGHEVPPQAFAELLFPGAST